MRRRPRRAQELCGFLFVVASTCGANRIRAEVARGVVVTDKVILLYGAGKREADRTWSGLISLETGKVNAGVSTADSSLSVLGNRSAQP
jgi:hypothetical protein